MGKTMGQHTIDRKVETILNDNSEKLRMMEVEGDGRQLGSCMDRDCRIGRKTSMLAQIIDQL